MNRYALSIDTETLDLKPTAHVLQVAGVVIDLDSGEVMTAFNTGIDNPPSRTMSRGTVQWWMQQPKDVADGVFTQKTTVPPDALFALLDEFFKKYEGLEVWANPATFDIPLLENLMGAAPWSHRKVRCLKTAASILDPKGLLRVPNPKLHDALSDATHQAIHLRNMYMVWKSLQQVDQAESTQDDAQQQLPLEVEPTIVAATGEATAVARA